jgi:tetratricopeptide (TPR) repeat protein
MGRWANALVLGLALAGCSTQGDLIIPETALMAHPLSLRPGGDTVAQAIAQLEIKEDWKSLATLANSQLTGGLPDDDWKVVLGYARMKSGDLPGAIETFRSVADRNPEDVDARSLLGESLRLSGQADRAVEVLEKAAQSHPNAHKTWFLLGEAYADASRLERAKYAYREAIRLETTYVPAWYGLAGVLSRVGPKDEYQDALERLRSLKPEAVQQHLKSVAERRR